MRFRIIPALTISRIETLSEPNMIAFGAVAAGSMKANEADIVAGIIKIRGFN